MYAFKCGHDSIIGDDEDEFSTIISYDQEDIDSDNEE